MTKFVERFEVITEEGRKLVLRNVDCQVSVQDNGKTLKVFAYKVGGAKQ